jgi:hypothetical protein
MIHQDLVHFYLNYSVLHLIFKPVEAQNVLVLLAVLIEKNISG